MSWLESDKDLLKTMWACGSSSRDIASALARPATRNAVMGMVDRLGLMGLGHADDARLATIARVSDIMGGAFSLGEPLHREALLTLTVVGLGNRSIEALATGSGISRTDCADFVERLPLVWPELSGVPGRWVGGLEGNFAFILDMAVLAGVLSSVPVRGRKSSSPAPVRRPGPSQHEVCPAT